MKKMAYSVTVAGLLFSTLAYSQQSVLSCVVKTASGEAKTRQVAEINVGTTFDVPIGALVENGAKYEGRDLLNTKRYGEETTLIVNRETGEFDFSSSMRGGSFLTDDLGYGTSNKRAAGICKIKKMKL